MALLALAAKMKTYLRPKETKTETQTDVDHMKPAYLLLSAVKFLPQLNDLHSITCIHHSVPYCIILQISHLQLYSSRFKSFPDHSVSHPHKTAGNFNVLYNLTFTILESEVFSPTFHNLIMDLISIWS